VATVYMAQRVLNCGYCLHGTACNELKVMKKGKVT
jgi:aerobic-type carbon monoxide dehydrogenase small subunit (CoxS/CutS family)